MEIKIDSLWMGNVWENVIFLSDPLSYQSRFPYVKYMVKIWGDVTEERFEETG